ncbi:MAG TPA: hypothetical protein VFO34_07160, partial [Candidatus Acidoferrales bacterium]|nr:hypothetical protein [Candidatus Acidoferrales bacterium]
DAGQKPGDGVEASARRLGKNLHAIFLDEILDDEVVRFSAGDMGVEFLEHRPGAGAADVIALDENLAAAADAHELHADLFGAIGLLGLEGRDREETHTDYENSDVDGKEIQATGVYFRG